MGSIKDVNNGDEGSTVENRRWHQRMGVDKRNRQAALNAEGKQQSQTNPHSSEL